jgi:hypothetical protein
MLRKTTGRSLTRFLVVAAEMKAIEVTGSVDARRQLHLDQQLPIDGPARVRVIVLVDDAGDIGEREWLRAASSNPVFGFLSEPAEDIYSPTDGKPFVDPR